MFLLLLIRTFSDLILELWTQILNYSVFIWARKLLEGWEVFLIRPQNNDGIALHLLLYFQGLGSLCGANTVTIDRREASEIALQLPSLVLRWFM